jgi:transposase
MMAKLTTRVPAAINHANHLNTLHICLGNYLTAALQRSHAMSEVEERLKGIPGTLAQIARDTPGPLSRAHRPGPTSSSANLRSRPRLAPSVLAFPRLWRALGGRPRSSAGASRFCSKAAFAPWTAPPRFGVVGEQHPAPLIRGGADRSSRPSSHLRHPVVWGRGHRGVSTWSGRMSNGDTETEAFRLLRRALASMILRRCVSSPTRRRGGPKCG